VVSGKEAMAFMALDIGLRGPPVQSMALAIVICFIYGDGERIA
jgi:hypothetical protein